MSLSVKNPFGEKSMHMAMIIGGFSPKGLFPQSLVKE
jgi:hypothetical protein